MSHVLVIGAERSHPQNQGNNNRIFRLCRSLQAMGATVHYLYCNQNKMFADVYKDMHTCWDHFHFVPASFPGKLQSYPTHFHIDDWYDVNVTKVVRDLCNKWNFSACIVNYVWFSKVLDYVPSSVSKIIDTHDIFGDRAEVCRQAGFKPTWYYTTIEQERIGLSRADAVLAIQKHEKKYFESIFDGDVLEMGYLTPPNFLPPSPITKKIRVGYIGSPNPFNMETARTFQESILKSYPQLLEKCEFVLAGQICEAFAADNEIYTMFGRVNRVKEFYHHVDIVINPMIGGTGLKIKSLEAMSYGVPFMGTEFASVGIPVSQKYMKTSCIAELAQCLEDVCNDSKLLLDMAKESKSVFLAYTERQMQVLGRFYEKYVL